MAARRLTDAGEKRRFWPALHEAAAHRAQAALRAADHVLDAVERERAVARAVDLFEKVIVMDDAALGFFDFLYEYCKALRRLGRDAAADAVFVEARKNNPAFPWVKGPARKAKDGDSRRRCELVCLSSRRRRDLGSSAAAPRPRLVRGGRDQGARRSARRRRCRAAARSRPRASSRPRPRRRGTRRRRTT